MVYYEAGESVECSLTSILTATVMKFRLIWKNIVMFEISTICPNNASRSKNNNLVNSSFREVLCLLDGIF